MHTRSFLPALLLGLSTCMVSAQSFPDEMYLSPDGRMMFTGRPQGSGFFDPVAVKNISMNFSQANYWTLLTQNYSTHTDLPATLSIDGEMFDSVGVRFKGMTSYSGTGNSQKKSFNITMDAFIDGQDIMGYKILNLNNCYQDPSFMREIFYQHQIRRHIPAAKSLYVKLYINGNNWGVYPCVQQLDGDFYKEWFLSNNGTNWRADKPPGSGGGWGTWGDGTAALNYLGADTSLYQPHYTLKKAHKPNPWDDLRDVCHVLDTVSPANMENILADYLDIDRALWFLGSEILFSDDDSYVYKGRMDYYVYYEAETGRITPIEYDGNSALEASAVTWSPFYHETNANYPLLNKILAVPSLRQRYIAHFRTLIEDEMDTATAFATLDGYKQMIDTMVQNDPKKIYSYNQFNQEFNDLKSFILDRRSYVLANPEISAAPPLISAVSYSAAGISWAPVQAMQPVTVNATASAAAGLDHVYLYYSQGLVGKFTKAEMMDDGLHGDSTANDGIFGGEIPGLDGAQWIRYYVEAVSSNSSHTVAYSPAGAEHDVYIYKIEPGMASDTSIVINELMASNTSTAVDSAGEYDDWIELFNTSAQPADLSGYYLTDNDANYIKWEFPSGTVLPPGEYLIIWADEDGSQDGLHANFKFSSSGEQLILLNSSRELVDEVTFGQQQTDMGYARVPNGSGPFVIQAPTFAANNNPTAVFPNQPVTAGITVFPNPAGEVVYITCNSERKAGLSIFDITGRIVYSGYTGRITTVDTRDFRNGVYVVQSENQVTRLVIHH